MPEPSRSGIYFSSFTSLAPELLQGSLVSGLYPKPASRCFSLPRHVHFVAGISFSNPIASAGTHCKASSWQLGAGNSPLTLHDSLTTKNCLYPITTTG
jgi:hypothetical protein